MAEIKRCFHIPCAAIPLEMASLKLMSFLQ
jgi:hypothetical protein